MTKHILYFDEHLFNQLLVKRILQKDGHETRCANDRECGWQLALSSQPDLILLDMNLECERGGIHLTRALRQVTTLQTCPIILLTQAGHSETEIEALAAGANGFLYKPAGIREIQTALRAILDRPEPKPVRRPVSVPVYAPQPMVA